MSSTVSIKVPTQMQAAILARLAARGFERRDVAHAFWQARGEGAVVTFYRSGKLVVQGRDAEELAAGLDPDASLSGRSRVATSSKRPAASRGGDASPYGDALAKLPDPKPDAWIGIDETGKGDFFGPLVVCAARVERGQLALLQELGVGDSKKLTDKRALALADQLKAIVEYEKVVLRPAKYNELYESFRNLNRLLAWGHAAAAASLLERVDAQLVLSDQFAKSNLVARELAKKEVDVPFVQRTRAEDDPAVAAASILARAEFLWQLDELERRFGVRLHKGAGAPVLRAGRALVKSHGAEILPDVAKVHFRTTQKITQ